MKLFYNYLFIYSKLLYDCKILFKILLVHEDDSSSEEEAPKANPATIYSSSVFSFLTSSTLAAAACCAGAAPAEPIVVNNSVMFLPAKKLPNNNGHWASTLIPAALMILEIESAVISCLASDKMMEAKTQANSDDMSQKKEVVVFSFKIYNNHFTPNVL